VDKNNVEIKKIRIIKCDRMIVEFPAKQWKWHMPFDLVRITDFNGNADLNILAKTM